MPATEIRDLRKTFSVPEGTEIAVDGVSIDIKEGEFFSLVGPSGCGKTTTLRCIAGLETPTSGEITVGGEDITDTPPHERNIAMMFQNIALYPHMLIKDNISYPLKVKGVPMGERYERAKEAAEIMQIPDLLEKYPGELSGGQRQRAALARTIVQDPVVFLMDEPLSDLDAKLKIDVREEIQRVHQNIGRPTVYVTHDQQEAMTMSDRIGVMNDGKLEQVGPPEELYHHPTNRFVGEFLGMPSMNVTIGTVMEASDDQVRLALESGDVSVRVDYAKDQIESGDEVLFGFRPEAVLWESDLSEGIEGTITLVEPVGDRTLLSIDSNGTEYRAVGPRKMPVEEGQTTRFGIRGDGVYLFDPDTEDLLVKGDEENSDSEQLYTAKRN